MTLIRLKDVKVDKILIYLLNQKIRDLKEKKPKYIQDYELEEALVQCQYLVHLYKNFK